MKLFVLIITLVFSSTLIADPQPIPTNQLEAYFQANGISYQSYGYHSGTTKPDGVVDDDSLKFLDYPDPDDDETLGLFFEFSLGVGLSSDSNMHLAAGIRGPQDYDVTGEVGKLLRGRGIAIGQLWYNHPDCTNPAGVPHPSPIRGFFAENFTAHFDGNPLTDIHATKCENINVPDNNVYRVDVHASKYAVYVAVWKKVLTFPFYGATYEFVGENGCVAHPSFPNDPDTINCRETDSGAGDDSSFGNGFITVAGSSPYQGWSAFNIFMAHWDS